MSLATTGGGGFGGSGGPGAMAMAHQANVGQGVPPPPQHDAHADTGHGPPPPSASVLGADLLDKQQAISLKQVKNVARFPIVAVDLFSSEPVVAYFPKKPDDPGEAVHPIMLGKMKSKVALKTTEASHKTFRKYLSSSKPFATVRADCLTKLDASDAVTLDRPHHWLGLRRIEDAPDFMKTNVKIETSSSPTTFSEPGVVLVNSSLDGSAPRNDDNDRVLFKVALNPSKKPLTVLPEEAVQLLLHQAQYHVHTKLLSSSLDSNGPSSQSEDDILDYPCAIAVPSWAAHDAAVEAVFDATGNAGVFFQRSVCALAGSLMLGADGNPNPVLERLQKVRAAMAKDYQRRKVEDPDAVFEEELLLIMFGMTEDGFEATGIQISSVQQTLSTCLFGNFKVLSNVSYLDSDPLSKLKACSTELEAAIEDAAPEADGPVAIVLYGTAAEQEKIQKKWNEFKTAQKEWTKVPVFSTKSDVVAMGTAILGAVTHGRQLVLVPKDNAQHGKMRAELGIRVHNVAPAAVGVRINYHGGDESKWTPVKTIFDFDRRIPAGPYPIELNASECVVHRIGVTLSDDAFMKAAKDHEGAKHIPKREEAALALRVEIMQRWTRGGEWKKVGDTMEPLVMLDPDDEEKKIACESVVLEITLGVHGMLTTNLVGERESVVQAVKTARNSAFRYYVGVVLAVLFFGGFLFKSYWDEYVLNRDTAKLLAYYHHVLPGSISDGDHRNAMHVVYGYRHNKAALWKKLETKYGVSVREANEWGDYKEDGSVGGEDSSINLDVDEEQSEADSEDESGKQGRGSGSKEDEL